MAVISLGGIVTSQSIRVGGDEMDQAIIAFAKKEYSLMVGERTAEQIKMAVGSAYPSPDEPHTEIRGRDLVGGLPKTIVMGAEEVRHAIAGPVSTVVDIVNTTSTRARPSFPATSWTAVSRSPAVVRCCAASMSGCAKRQGCRSSWPTIRWNQSCSAPANASRTSTPSSRC